MDTTICGEPAESRSSMLFRPYLDQTFGHQDETKNLSPFRNDVANDLSPPAFRIHGPECDHPTDAGHYKNQRERVLTDELKHRRRCSALKLFAFGRPFLVEEFCHHDGDKDS